MEMCFNSTLVQLKALTSGFIANVRNSFNSTLVQLKVNAVMSFFSAYSCFNSTLVQLKAGYNKRTEEQRA